ncbi:MAG: tRNA (adenosine(37)-N6)-dimethylallyltransferase MiaA [Uliginosibacterium sp.]|nr:tRNA (adenosine(37)-N6)-dimethylallyltransferase MiaA [Uliginosibacterium sp.]
MRPPLTPRAVFIMGPTASGKTQLALSLARHLPIEVISVDSALVYRDMDIGTAKPSREELASCPHHLVDIISPEEAYSAARFCSEARTLIDEISQRGRIPVLVGGTMLYFKALRDGLSELPQADPDVREAIEHQARRDGWPALHAALATLDPDAAAHLNPNDSQRIQRALEIVRLSGRPLAENYAQRSDTATAGDYLSFALTPADRSTLHTRIAERLDLMLSKGLQDELIALKKSYRLDPDMTSMRCVGYRQMWEYLDGNTRFEEMRFKAIAATRQLAKRQITWLRQFTKNWPCMAAVDPQAGNPLPQLLRATEAWWQQPL